MSEPWAYLVPTYSQQQRVPLFAAWNRLSTGSIVFRGYSTNTSSSVFLLCVQPGAWINDVHTTSDVIPLSDGDIIGFEIAGQRIEFQLEYIGIQNILNNAKKYNNLKTTKFQAYSDPNLCPVCLTEEPNDALQTECGHVYCCQCMRQILQNTKTCALCRKKLTISELKKPLKRSKRIK
eukprot:851371_1